ncbi:MAG TPA: signal peptidase II [Allosphingosinicella sp.]|jgi:signal peptidase II|nr:signal peptidase II [Allosphingosinicella sp.]
MADLSRDAERMRKNRKVGLAVAALIFVVDQAVKWVVTYPLQLPHRQTIELLPFFTLRWLKNTGVSMGLLPADGEVARWLLVALTVAIAAFVAFWMWREKRRDDTIALALVLGGALGNILDRVRLGYVVDYADLHIGGVHPFLVFNVGDAAITIGVLLLLVRALLTRERKVPEEEK